MNHNYRRVIPRDLFNEANLLKCYGQLYLVTEKYVEILLDYDEESEEPFYVRQNDSDGSLSIDNIDFFVHGRWVALFRPINSREPWPLYARVDDHEFPVFNERGALSDEFKAFMEKTRGEGQ